jgi:hypothetical protein
VAEADGNRTRRGCVATPSYGFEVRGPHQRDNRFRGGVYRKTAGISPAFGRRKELGNGAPRRSPHFRLRANHSDVFIHTDSPLLLLSAMPE